MSLSPYKKKLNKEEAAHFVRRTAFGGTEQQIEALAGQDARKIAKEALKFSDARAKDNPFDPTQGATAGAAIRLNRAAWLYEMIYGPAPLRELLALTWSNHFVIGTDKVKNVHALTTYLDLLRQHAASRSFRQFTLDVSKHPAMLHYLDNAKNKKNKPNENFSRELLELFTTGIGHYTEEDVLEGARALSGWTFKGGRGNKNYLEKNEFVFNRKQHDRGTKTYLGKTGKFDGEDIVRLAVAHPATATYVCRKLHRAFVSDTPDEQAVKSSAATFTRSNGNIRVVLEELLASEVFYQSQDQIIRGPVAYAVGALRSLGSPKLPTKRLLNLSNTLGSMGQVLLHPETVKGWDGGREWINDTTLLQRMQLAAQLTLNKQAPELAAPSTLALLGQENPQLPPSFGRLNTKQRTYLMLISPEFQLL